MYKYENNKQSKKEEKKKNPTNHTCNMRLDASESESDKQKAEMQ